MNTELAMQNNEIPEILKKLNGIDFFELWNEIRPYDLKTIEDLAIEIHWKDYKSKKDVEVLNSLLSVRKAKLDEYFQWTDKNKIRLIKINAYIMETFNKAYNELRNIAFSLERRINNNDPWLKDYELEISLTPLIKGDYDENICRNILVVLSEPQYSYISYGFSHSHYNSMINEIPTYMDKSVNWNNEFFNGEFNGYYICYEIHQLLEIGNWSFRDILNIEMITADIEVIHQHYTENI
jgi:hypothetical protein